MEDVLLEQRKHFDKGGKTAYFGTSELSPFKEAVRLIDFESHLEYAYRRELIRGKIIGLGLGPYISEITDGMNQTCGRVIPFDEDTLVGDVKNIQRLMRVASDSLLRFGLDYIDRWNMYNELFGSEE